MKKGDRELLKVRSVDPNPPPSNIIPKKKETKNNLRNRTAYCPEINSDRYEKIHVFVNRIIFKFIYLVFLAFVTGESDMYLNILGRIKIIITIITTLYLFNISVTIITDAK